MAKAVSLLFLIGVSLSNASATVPACCPVGGIWSEWTVTGCCPTTCGSCSNATRVRTCTSMVDNCPCAGEATDVGPCDIAMCQFPEKTCCFAYKKSLNGNTNAFFCGTGNTPTNPTYDCPTSTTTTTTATTSPTTAVVVPTCCPAGGVWSEWTVTGCCPTTCGSCNNATRVRTCTSMVDNCPCAGDATDVGPCGIAMCSSPEKTCCFNYKKSLNGNTNAFFCGSGNTPTNPTYDCPTTTTSTTTTKTTTTARATTCYESITSRNPYEFLERAIVETQRDCELLCDANDQCAGFAFEDHGLASTCVLLQNYTSPNKICSAPATMFLKKTVGCT